MMPVSIANVLALPPSEMIHSPVPVPVPVPATVTLIRFAPLLVRRDGNCIQLEKPDC
jgi:hypothetical protein